MIRHLLALSLLTLCSLTQQAQAENIETNITLQLKVVIQLNEEEAGIHVQQKSSTYAFKTADLIQRLTQGEDYGFTSKARLVQRIDLKGIVRYVIVEKNVGEYNVTSKIKFGFTPHLSSQRSSYVINKKVVKNTDIGLYKIFGLGFAQIATQGDDLDLDLQGPVHETRRHLASKDDPTKINHLINKTLIASGCIDFTGEDPITGIVQGTLKIGGHKITRTPPSEITSLGNPNPPPSTAGPGVLLYDLLFGSSWSIGNYSTQP